VKNNITMFTSSVRFLCRQTKTGVLLQDNPEFAPLDRDGSMGYFGVQVLSNLPRPPNASIDWEPSLVLNGDFDGIKLYDSMQDFVSGKTRAYLSLGDIDHGKVLSLVLCEWTQVVNRDSNEPPCCFMGYNSGCVAALTATLTEDDRSYVFAIKRHQRSHDFAVTALTLVNCGSTAGTQEIILFSACHCGQVLYYPNAANPTKNFTMESLPAFCNAHPIPCPILSMTSTVIMKGEEQFILLCTGDSDGSIRLWMSSSDFLFKDYATNKKFTFHHVKWYKSKGRYRVATMKFIQNNILLSGNNRGDIRLWDLCCTGDSGENDRHQLPGLILRIYLKSAHSGPIEMSTYIGNVLLTSGGNDGKVVGWDIKSGKRIGALCCHQGKEVIHLKTREKCIVKSCVVGIVSTGRGSKLVSLCRDGVISEWRFA